MGGRVKMNEAKIEGEERKRKRVKSQTSSCSCTHACWIGIDLTTCAPLSLNIKDGTVA